jgi:hypothetical protein
MTKITAKGTHLACKLSPSIGVPDTKCLEICSLIHRHAATHQKIVTAECNESRSPQREWLDNREQQLRKRIDCLVRELPSVNGRAITPVYQYDPRGQTVRLRMPDGRFDSLGGVKAGLSILT